MTTAPCLGSASACSSSAPTVAAKPRLRASSAMRCAMPSAVPRLEPNNTSSGVACASAAASGFVAAAEAGEGALAARRGGWSGRLLGRREKPRRRAPRARLHANDEIRRLDRQRLFGLELIIGEVDKLEALQQHGQDERRLLQRELAADAGALPSAEGLIGVGRNLRPVLGAEAVGVKGLGIVAPDFWIAVQHPGEHHDGAVRLDLILAAEDGVLVRAAREGRGGRPEPQRLLEDLRDIGQLVGLGVGRQRVHIPA